MRNSIILLTCLLCLCSCSHYPVDIESVLKQAGRNRGALEKVLKHYGNNPADSLKLRAAKFLIVNMPGKYSEYYDSPWNDVATVMLRWTSSSDKQLVLDAYKLSKPVRKDDVTHITAEYLINNIELSFKVWQEQPWGKNISFDIFCEEILPYRLNVEPLENWREKALASFNDLYMSFKNDTTITTIEACTRVNDKLPRFRIDKDFPPMNYSQLMASTRGYCDEMAALAIFTMRALGIPVSYDYTPLWPDRNYGHSWNSVYCDTSGLHISFMGAETNPGDLHQGIINPISKIYRRTFSIQNNIQTEQIHIPPILQDVNMTDATADYKTCVDIKIPVTEDSSSGTGYAYLATPFEMEWNPVAWGLVEQDSIRFSSVGKNVLYMPVYYQNNTRTVACSPFWLNENGNYHFFKPDSTQLVKITRIIPPTELWVQRMVGGIFEVANKADFSDAKRLYTIRKIDGPWFHTTNINNVSKYRYIRYVSPESANCNVAEIEFYNKSGEKLQGDVIGTTESWENSSMTRDKAFDNDPATFFDASNDQSWTGLDLGEPQTVTRIRYLPRNDGEGIYEGYVYEMFYWDGNEWQSAGKKRADNNFLEYEVPSNTLYIIRNTTKGVIYRRPFIIENGEQKWLAMN